MVPERVAIVSVAQTKYEKAKHDKELNEIIFHVTKEALDKSGLTREKVSGIGCGVLGGFWIEDARPPADS